MCKKTRGENCSQEKEHFEHSIAFKRVHLLLTNFLLIFLSAFKEKQEHSLLTFKASSKESFNDIKSTAIGSFIVALNFFSIFAVKVSAGAKT